jgi:hypothetical protein
MLWLGKYHPMIVDPAEMSAGRKKLGWLAVAIFAWSSSCCASA